jgi:hypothetical protein
MPYGIGPGQIAVEAILAALKPCALVAGLLSDHGDGRAHGATVSAEVHDYVPPASVGRA